MQDTLTIAAFWLGLAVLSAIIAKHLRISIALVEICVGAVAGAVVASHFGREAMGSDLPWLKFAAGMGAILLTFLAGAELDPMVVRTKWKEVLTVGLIGFAAPFLGCAALAHWVLGWSGPSSLLTGVALSTTSMAVVYAVLLESGLNRTEYGKGILGACFINDLGTVIALGILFAPFTVRTLIFIAASVAAFALLPYITSHLTSKYAFRTAAIRAKWILFVLCGLGALALWAGSEAVLPAYIAGMVLAGSVSRDEHFIRRFRTLTVGFLTPFYFLRAGSLVSAPTLVAGLPLIAVLLGGKTASKIFGLFPVITRFRDNSKERWYYTLLMSTGLTFGTISALYGLSHNIIDAGQYSFIVAAVIFSAVVPALIANLSFFPKHIIGEVTPPPLEIQGREIEAAMSLSEEEEAAEE